MTNPEYVILVDLDDNPIGMEEKLRAHQLGVLHRAFSVCLLRQWQGEWQVLLQQRAMGKYHSAGLWSNACCSHPRLNETLQEAAERRLFEELGVMTTLQPIGKFVYEAALDQGLTEHELDHVLVGFLGIGDEVVPNPDEVMNYRWEPLMSLPEAIEQHPEYYTAWLKEVIQITIGFVAEE